MSLPLFTLSKSHLQWTIQWVQQCLNDPNFPTPAATRQHRETLLKIISAYVRHFSIPDDYEDFVLESEPIGRASKITSTNSLRRAASRFRKTIFLKTIQIAFSCVFFVIKRLSSLGRLAVNNGHRPRRHLPRNAAKQSYGSFARTPRLAISLSSRLARLSCSSVFFVLFSSIGSSLGMPNAIVKSPAPPIRNNLAEQMKVYQDSLKSDRTKTIITTTAAATNAAVHSHLATTTMTITTTTTTASAKPTDLISSK